MSQAGNHNILPSVRGAGMARTRGMVQVACSSAKKAGGHGPSRPLSEAVFGAGDDVVLGIRREGRKEGRVTGHPHHQIPVLIRVGLGRQ